MHRSIVSKKKKQNYKTEILPLDASDRQLLELPGSFHAKWKKRTIIPWVHFMDYTLISCLLKTGKFFFINLNTQVFIHGDSERSRDDVSTCWMSKAELYLTTVFILKDSERTLWGRFYCLRSYSPGELDNRDHDGASLVSLRQRTVREFVC